MLQPRMKVRFIESLGGKNLDGERVVYGAGQVVDLPPREAKDWISQGLAEEFKEEKKAKPVTVQQVKAETRPVRKTVKK